MMIYGVNPNIHIGEQYGIYVIDSVLEEKDRYGHYVYCGICQECGLEKYGTMHDFKDKNVTMCKHFSQLTQDKIDRWYEANKKQCLHCGKDIPLNGKNPNEYRRQKFCSTSCSASYNNQQKRKPRNCCLNCGNELSSTNGKYCSAKCQQEFHYKQYIERWKKGEEDGIIKPYALSGYIKKYLFEKYNNRCSKCGWSEINQFTGNIPLEVHHKDGNYANNVEDNLELLCPNCHSLTATYKNSNSGNGRKERQKYNQ